MEATCFRALGYQLVFRSTLRENSHSLSALNLQPLNVTHISNDHLQESKKGVFIDDFKMKSYTHLVFPRQARCFSQLNNVQSETVHEAEESSNGGL